MAIDAGYMTDVVYAFCNESKSPFGPAVGRGAAVTFTDYRSVDNLPTDDLTVDDLPVGRLDHAIGRSCRGHFGESRLRKLLLAGVAVA